MRTQTAMRLTEAIEERVFSLAQLAFFKGLEPVCAICVL